MRRFLLFLSLTCPALAVAQAALPDTSGLESCVRSHVEYLASDKLRGRLTGSKEERAAAKYIQQHFAKCGLKPAPLASGWLQPFSFYTGYRYGKQNSMSWQNGNVKEGLHIDHDWYPIAYSADGKAEGNIMFIGSGLDTAALKGITGKIFLVDLSIPEPTHPHDKVPDWQERLDRLKNYNPAAIIFANSPHSMDIYAYKRFHNLNRENLLLVHLNHNAIPKEGLKSLDGRKISLSVELQRSQVEGNNVVGFIDNGKPLTVVVGAHYDHLGQGEFGNSLHAGEEKAIHNGADDNASGTAVVMELACLLRKDPSPDYNYLLIAFSGEEEGLLGSNYFTKNPTLPIDKISYMLNLDMVGRLDSAKRELGINGTGTSTAWDSVIHTVLPGRFIIKTTASGMGSSDHTSFYLQKVPALHFFTGVHTDYHKPSDDAEKINYAGIADVTVYLYELIQKLDNHPKLAFTETKDSTERLPQLKVTLGVMPDYFYDKPGLRIEGVTKDKPAAKAGLQAGDVILKIGDYEVGDIRDYMRALSHFEKGQAVPVKVKRGELEVVLQVAF